MLQISPSLLPPRDRIPHRHLARPQPPNLWKHKPHPVAPLLSRPQLRANPLIHSSLRLHKPLESEPVALRHACLPKNHPYSIRNRMRCRKPQFAATISPATSPLLPDPTLPAASAHTPSA